MDSKRVFYVRISGELRGPVGVEQLRDLADVEVITPDTTVARSPDGPWEPLATLAICPEVFPARRVLGFKAAEFETINRESAPGMDPKEVIEQAHKVPESFRGREVVVTPQVVRGPREGDPPNDVQEMVLEVGRRVAANAPVVLLPSPPPRYPRWRWFLALAITGSTGIWCIPLLYDGRYDETSITILAGWVVLYDMFLLYLMFIDHQQRERGGLPGVPSDKRE